MNAYGSSGTSVSAPLWRITVLPRKALSEVVDDLGWRQDRGLQQLLALLPADRALPTPTAEPVAPRLLRRAAPCLSPPEVPLATIILEMPASRQAAHPVLVVHGRLTWRTTPPPQRLLRAAEPLPGCPACDPPQPPARLRPVGGQSAALACAGPRVGRLVAVRCPQRHPRRLRRLHGPADTGAPLWQHRHDPAGVCFPRTAEDTIIGNAGEDASARQAWPYVALQPCIPHMMEEDMRSPR